MSQTKMHFCFNIGTMLAELLKEHMTFSWCTYDGTRNKQFEHACWLWQMVQKLYPTNLPLTLGAYFAKLALEYRPPYFMSQQNVRISSKSIVLCHHTMLIAHFFISIIIRNQTFCIIFAIEKDEMIVFISFICQNSTFN